MNATTTIITPHNLCNTIVNQVTTRVFAIGIFLVAVLWVGLFLTKSMVFTLQHREPVSQLTVGHLILPAGCNNPSLTAPCISMT